MNYNTKYICTYNDKNIFREEDTITEKDKEFVMDAMYRNDILYIFDIEEFDKDIVCENLKILYEKIKLNETFNDILKKFANIYLSDDAEIGLLILYSYDFLYLSHPIISEYLGKGQISEENINKLNNILKK